MSGLAMNSARNDDTFSLGRVAFRVALTSVIVASLRAIGDSPALAAGCGTAVAHGGPQRELVDVQVTIIVGPVSCRTARRVIADSINSTAPFRGHGTSAYTTIDGWQCRRPT